VVEQHRNAIQNDGPPQESRVPPNQRRVKDVPLCQGLGVEQWNTEAPSVELRDVRAECLPLLIGQWLRTPAAVFTGGIGLAVSEENLLNYEQAGAYLNVGRSTMYDLVGRGELPVVKIGRCARFRPEDLRNFVDARVTRKNR